MKKNFLKTAVVCLSMSLPVVGQAFAQDAGQMALKAEDTPRLKRNTIELRPFEILMSSVPGIASAGATFETYLTNQWALVVGGSYADVDLSTSKVDWANKETNEPILSSGYGFSTGAGLRFYEDPIGSSLYGGAGLDYSEIKSKWTYDDDTYKATQYAVTPSVVAGYRWVLQNGILFRVGAGAGMPQVESQKTTAETSTEQTAEGLDKLNDLLDQNVIAKVDLAVGYSF